MELNDLAKAFFDKFPQCKDEALWYVKEGRGYSDPTDLFNGGCEEVEFEEAWDELYSREGAVALMNVAIGK